MLTWIKSLIQAQDRELSDIFAQLTSLDYQGYLSTEATVLLTSELMSS